MKGKIFLLNKILEKKPFICFAYLFGSRASQKAITKSDWDIAIYFLKPMESISCWYRFELEAELARKIHADVQIVDLNNYLPPVFGFQIINKNILLVDKDKNKRIEFENKIIRNYHDWQYFLRRNNMLKIRERH